MDDGDWGALESAWATKFRPIPHTAPLPLLVKEADKAVKAAIDSLTKEYESVVGVPSSLLELESASKIKKCTAEQDMFEPLKTEQRDVVDDGESGVVNWPKLYESLCLVQAPMVRCSRPAFRCICRLWGTRISYTHMLIAESFIKSPHARHAEFALYEDEDRLIVQLAAKSGPVAAQAATLVRPYCDAVDLNCGCPQRWAMKEGIGAALLEKPELVADMVRSIRNATPEGNGDTPALPCVVKMRLHEDIRRSVDFARHCEAAGAAWVTVHGRTPHCHPSAAVQFDAVRYVRESLSIPVVLNGGVSDVSSALEAALRTGCGGLMSANGLLDNPAMFYWSTSASALEKEMTFGGPTSGLVAPNEGEEAKSTTAAEATSSPFTPIRPVSFQWAPHRETYKGSDVSRLPPPCSSTVFRYTVPSMWEATVTPREVISDFVRCAIRTDLVVPTTVQQVLRMARMYLSPAERNHLALLRSNLSVLSCLQEIGVYVREGHLGCER